MQTKNKGFFLITILIYLMIFSLISLYHLTAISAMMKSNNHLLEAATDHYRNLQILKKLESNFINNISTCSIPITPAATLANKPDSFWLTHACHDYVDRRHAYYTIEALGENACALIEHTSFIASYYRLTLFLKDDLNGVRYLIQSTIVRSVAPTIACQQNTHIVKPGPQARREI
jgi:hypothetical protein